MTTSSSGTTLGAALAEALPRLCSPGPVTDPAGLTPAQAAPMVVELIAALAASLAAGRLELDFGADAPEGLDPERWPRAYRQALADSPLVVSATALAEVPEAPLVLVGDRLRWRRWHQQLEHCLESLVQRARAPLPSAPEPAFLEQALAAAAAAGLDSSQQQAVRVALSQPLLLLSGGPGTGKTSTIVQLIAALQRQQPRLRLQLTAPTGKAAARLREAIDRGCRALEPALAAPLRAAPCGTLHRLLESNGERFGRDRRRPLELDLLVVDEVSMVDLPLMAALVDALPADCRLVLVGDPAQLPPVGPGAVLLELQQPQRLAALGPAAVELGTTYRNNGAIAAVAASLRAAAPGGGALRRQLEQLGDDDNLSWQVHPAQQLPPPLLARLRQHQEHLAELAAALPWLPPNASMVALPEPKAAAALLAALELCQVLSPLRQGRWGVEAIHRALLGERLGRPLAQWPLGTPVLNPRNLPEQGLANGDIGVLVERRGERLVLFAGPRPVHPARLGHAEPALALTVHKAQGSEMEEVLILLPDSDRIDPRLLYTALTRARRHALLISPPGHRWLTDA